MSTINIIYVLACCRNVIEKRVHVRHDQIITRGELKGVKLEIKTGFKTSTLIQMAKHFAAADIGGNLASEENPNSKRGKGEVTKRRRWLTIVAAIVGKLEGKSVKEG